jgi:endonuclease YncB( thermonuclease family)
MLKTLAFTLFASILGAVPAHAQVISGPAIAIDGDTLDMTGTRVRLIGIDAPEAQQTCMREGESWACGAEATASLAAILQDVSITCKGAGTDDYGRMLGRCQTPVFDIGQELVRRGMALPKDHALTDYSQAHAIAQTHRFGLWSGEFQAPADWRAANPELLDVTIPVQPEPSMSQQVSQSLATAFDQEQRITNSTGCTIKGNRNQQGDWIYHLRGQNYYDVTRAERLFCTESEARAAGYRRSKR